MSQTTEKIYRDDLNPRLEVFLSAILTSTLSDSDLLTLLQRVESNQWLCAYAYRFRSLRKYLCFRLQPVI